MAVSSINSMFLFLTMMLFLNSCYGFGRIPFHHRYSDRVTGILSLDGLPVKGSPGYYKVMAHRDRTIHGRRLGGSEDSNEQTPLTFANGNDTYQLTSLGYLHYANVSVGTPALTFLVALDTGSDLFWLPCDCKSCVKGLKYSDGGELDFNIYSPSKSSTSQTVSCNSTLCDAPCLLPGDNCAYQVQYLSDATSSTGYYVDDVIHLVTNDKKEKASAPQITLGCGVIETGSFLDGAAINGLFGLGMDNVSVPSTLAQEGVASNSFSMCFGMDGVGRISFGDQGTSDQGETPFYVSKKNPTYNITVTRINVGGKADNIQFSAIFDTGTSFTYLNDPAYTHITTSFNSQAKEKRYISDANSSIPFDYCYELSANQESFEVPDVNLTMKGGDLYPLLDAVVVASTDSNETIYCLGVVKSDDVNIIGQNFMTGYNIIFDREKMMLGWKASTCYDIVEQSTTQTLNPKNNTAVSPATAVDPEASGNGNSSHVSAAAPGPGGVSHSAQLKAYTLTVIMVLIISILAFV